MSQHGSLTPERWSRFTLDQRILMIANELQRATRWLVPAELEARTLCYERALRLTDLTIATTDRPRLRRELLRWRDLIALLYTQSDPDETAHSSALRALLQLTPVAARQVEHLTAARPADAQRPGSGSPTS